MGQTPALISRHLADFERSRVGRAACPDVGRQTEVQRPHWLAGLGIEQLLPGEVGDDGRAVFSMSSTSARFGISRLAPLGRVGGDKNIWRAR